MADKLDYVKQYKEYYSPKTTPALVRLPAMVFIMVDGAGSPDSAAYQNAVSLLYSLSFTIKMSKMGGEQPPGYTDYTMPPLEGLWTLGAGGTADREAYRWTSMIRQPEFVTAEVFDWARRRAAAKKPGLDFSPARLEAFEEGLCVQALHKGPYADEPHTLAAMEAFIKENGLLPDFEGGRRHHEIYLGNPQRTRPENLRTVLRLPVRPA